MLKLLMCFFGMLFLFLSASSLGYAQTNEQITLTTYYPSPYGSYVEVRSKRLAVGDNYISPTYCWPPTFCANQFEANADLVVEGNVIIGTMTPDPAAKLEVAGDTILSGIQEGANHGLYIPNGDITVEGGPDGVFGFLHNGSGASTINFGTPYWPPNTWTMTINTTTGRVGIGTIAPAYQLELSQDSAAKPTSNTWTVPSDSRVKKDIEPFNDGLDVINQINPVRYKLNGKAGLPLDKEGISIIAQDIKDVAPYTIKTWKAKLEPTDTKETDLYDFDSGPLTFVIINAIKEQQRKIERLEAEIVELKSRISARE